MISVFILSRLTFAQEANATVSTETEEQKQARFTRIANELLALGFTQSRETEHKSAIDTYELDVYTGKIKLKDLYRITETTPDNYPSYPNQCAGIVSKSSHGILDRAISVKFLYTFSDENRPKNIHDLEGVVRATVKLGIQPFDSSKSPKKPIQDSPMDTENFPGFEFDQAKCPAKIDIVKVRPLKRGSLIYASLSIKNESDKAKWFVFRQEADVRFPLDGRFDASKKMNAFAKRIYYGYTEDKNVAQALEVEFHRNNYFNCGFRAFHIPPNGTLQIAKYEVTAYNGEPRLELWVVDELLVNGETPLEKWLPFATLCPDSLIVPAEPDENLKEFSKKAAKDSLNSELPKAPVDFVQAGAGIRYIFKVDLKDDKYPANAEEVPADAQEREKEPSTTPADK
jgi:hypothetical protein